ncbi:30S ribosomal protein S17 [Reticulomyxa filosa]|uniref:30S ribosomal protein S17 n=1 Tax=Reticulomyxa filosa TaxID=46433 RepID=X6P6E0_RETFI|nr:30S ribosomal protein S17 [Reticulomyxa filosa]|eukprot:ETO33751.1 30S ribosomal protein S17 [Reticulomyxa filosa]
MGLKTVDAFVKQSGKQHVISVYRKRGKNYFQATVPPLNELKNMTRLGQVPPLRPFRNGYFVGRVIACRNAKTATVLMSTGKWQPYRWQKTTWGIEGSKKYHIHDEYEITNPGDIVMFCQANPPFSKIKKFGLVEVIRPAPIWEDYPAWEGTTEGDFHVAHPSDPDRDDIQSHTQRLMKMAQEKKDRVHQQLKEISTPAEGQGEAKEQKKIHDFQKLRQRHNTAKRKLKDVSIKKLKAWEDQVTKYGFKIILLTGAKTDVNHSCKKQIQFQQEQSYFLS